MDAYGKDPENYQVKPEWHIELDKFSHRPYDTGFYFASPQKRDSNVDFTSTYIQTRDFVGIVLDWDESTGRALVEQRNVIVAGDTLEILQPKGEVICFSAEMWDEEENVVPRAPHPKQKLWVKTPHSLEKGSVVRKVVQDEQE